MEVSPPQYRRLSRPGAGSLSSSAVLPPYSRRNTLAQPVIRREPTEHLYQLFDSRAKPWVSLKIFSSAKSSKSLPTFFEKENVNGSLELDVDKSDSIQAITAIVTGRIITGANDGDTLTFLNINVPVWSKNTDIPRLASPSPGANSSKLHGRCYWPLSIALPRVLSLPGDLASYRLPETFLERHTRVSIQYDLTILISRGRMRTDSQIKTAFGYVPSSRPDPPSMLRQLAYQQRLPLPGPEVDPEGWKFCAPVRASGKVFKTRRVDISCNLFLANPLSYTRGSVLPCYMVLEGQDGQALDLLSAPTSVSLVLQRQVKYHCKSSRGRHDISQKESPFEDVGTAVWWPTGPDRSASSVRHLEGEIHLAKDLRPTSYMGHFSISYSVVLRPFNAVGFAPATAGPLITEPVDITTMHAKGPRAHAYAPPSYDSSSS